MGRLFAPLPEETITVPITSSQYFTFPAGVTKANFSGRGERGEDGGEYLVQEYSYGYAKVTYYRDGREPLSEFGGGYGSGPTPSNYCTSQNYSSGAISSIETCYTYTDQSYWETYPPSSGSSSRIASLGLTFPGSYGNVTPQTVSFTNITVVPGTQYFCSIAPGGRITITYTQ